MKNNKKLVYTVKLTRLPKYMGYQDIHKFLTNTLGKIYFCKLKTNNKVAHFTTSTEEDAIECVKLLDNAKLKKMTIKAEVVAKEEALEESNKSYNQHYESIKTASDLVTPLANLPYSEQLDIKFKTSNKIIVSIIKQLTYANSVNIFYENVLQKVLPAPCITSYRNKCEFAIGLSKSRVECKKQKAKARLTLQAKEKGILFKENSILTQQEEDDNEDIINNLLPQNLINVGFINGKMINKSYNVLPIDNCQNLTLNTISIVKHFQLFVRESKERQFNEFTRKGFWKMLTVRDFLGDCMIIVTVHPHDDPEISSKIKQKLVEKFLPTDPNNLLPDCNVTSIYWQEQINSSDEKNYELLAGPPFVYETLLGCNFRISPSTFFQTNSTGAALLYSTIGDLLNLPKLINIPGGGNGKFNNRLEEIQNNDGGECNAKKPRLDEEKDDNEMLNAKSKPNGSNVFLDICCGSGSIGICLMSRIRQSIQEGIISEFSKVPYGCVGVDLNIEAIRDARQNAIENGFSDKSCKYIGGQAECVFKDLKYYMPFGCSLNDSNIMGLLDPPRAGIPDKVIIWCRKLIQLKTLIYISCDPQAATKNFVDLCRPMSCKYDGEPFKIVAIQPVDLFPMTSHFEWIIKFER